MMGYADTYYARTLAEASPRPALEGSEKADAVIVGGGLAGLTAALELARAGRSVIVLEAERVGWGASGRNGGFVGPGYATSHANITRMVGAEQRSHPAPHVDRGRSHRRGQYQESGLTDNKLVYGKMSVLRYHDPDGLARQRDLMEKEFGYHLEVMPTDAVRAVLRSSKYHQALYDAACFISTRSIMLVRWQGPSRPSAERSSRHPVSPGAISRAGKNRKDYPRRGQGPRRDSAGGGYTDDLVPGCGEAFCRLRPMCS